MGVVSVSLYKMGTHMRRMVNRCSELRRVNIVQGTSKISRDVDFYYDLDPILTKLGGVPTKIRVVNAVPTG